MIDWYRYLRLRQLLHTKDGRVQGEVSIILNAYALAGIPILLLATAGWMIPMYRLPWRRLACWWSWMALSLVASAFVVVMLLG